MKFRIRVAVSGAACLLLATCAILVFSGTSRTVVQAVPPNVYDTRPVSQFTAVLKEVPAYRGVGFLKSYADKVIFRSQWFLHAADAKTGKLAWSSRVKAKSPIAIDNGTIFCGGENGAYAVNALDGRTLWVFGAGNSFYSHSPVVEHGRVYFCDERGTVHALEQDSGAELWSCNLPSVSLSPLPFEDILLMFTDCDVIAIDQEGRKRWHVRFEYGRPCWADVVAGHAYVRSSGRELYGISSDGEVFLRIDIPRNPVLSNHKMYYSTNDGRLECYDCLTHQGAWTVPMGELASDIVLHGQVLICLTREGALRCLDIESGELLWHSQVSKQVGHAKLQSAESVCAYIDETALHVLDIASGESLWALSDTHDVGIRLARELGPVVDDIIMCRYRGAVIAYEGRSGVELWRSSSTKQRLTWQPDVTQGNVIYFSTIDGLFHCVDPLTGNEEWSLRPPGLGIQYSPAVSEFGQTAVCATTARLVLLVPLDGEGPVDSFETDADISCSPSVAEERTYLGLRTGELTCYKNHVMEWSVKADGAVTSQVAIGDRCIYFGTDAGTLYAVNAEEGSLLWKVRTGSAINTSPALFENSVYVGNEAGEIYAFDTAGVKFWTHRARGGIVSSPVTDGNLLYMADDTNRVFALRVGDGEEVWSVGMKACVSRRMGLSKGALYFGCNDGSFYAVNASDGTGKWRIGTSGAYTSGPCVARDIVYFGSEDGHLYAADAGSGKIEWKFRTGGAVTCPPAVKDGKLYLGSMDGFFCVIE